MKIYKYQNTNNFIDNGLSEFKLFNYYDSPRISRYFDYYEQRLIDSSRFEMPIIPQILDYNLNELNQYNLKSQYIDITIRPSQKFYLDQTWKDRFSLQKRQKTSLECEFLAIHLRREDHIRRLEYPSIYVYLNIPHEFLLDNLTTHIGNADLRKVYKELENVDLDDFIEILKAFKSGDDKYGKELKQIRDNHPPKEVYKWRWDVYPDMINSVYKFGYGYPVMNGNTRLVLFDGSHRLATSPIVKKDYPILQQMPLDYVRGKDRSIFIATPPYFNSNQIAIFEIDIDRKNIGGWFVHKDVIDFGRVSEDNNLFVLEPVKNSRILKRIKSLTYDFKFVF